MASTRQWRAIVPALLVILLSTAGTGAADPVAVSPAGDADGEYIAFSGTGEARGRIALSGTGTANACEHRDEIDTCSGWVGASLTGPSSGRYAVSGTGDADGRFPVSLVGGCRTSWWGFNWTTYEYYLAVREAQCFAVELDRDASGYWAGVSVHNRSSGMILATSAFGPADSTGGCLGPYLLVAGFYWCHEEGGYVTASGTGDSGEAGPSVAALSLLGASRGGFLSASLGGDASQYQSSAGLSASLLGNATACNQHFYLCVAASGTGDAEGETAVSVWGSARGERALSVRDTTLALLP